MAKGEDSPFKGRPATIDVDKVRETVARLGNKTHAARELGISRQSVYRLTA
ncbi:helix-turn-helix domain-containing protein [Boseongicola aestuarii]|uniref:helix-turn-helix domain-containing protein n=1 Tax=Boseongicola aestuarii TaxID=1470561 RepID=UPI001C3CBF16